MVNGIDSTQLLRLIEDEDAQIVDVLSEAEYVEAHLPGALNIPLKRLAAEQSEPYKGPAPLESARAGGG